MDTEFTFEADQSNINLKVAVDLYAEHQRLREQHVVQEAAGASEEASLSLKQARCIYDALCILARYYGFDIQEVIQEYAKSPFPFQLHVNENPSLNNRQL
jgi:hypothetical protein